MKAYTTILEAIQDLQAKGYNDTFSIEGKMLQSQESRRRFQPEEVVIDKVVRFEGETNPSDAAILYAISSTQHEVKGLLQQAYGAYSDPESADVIASIPTGY